MNDILERHEVRSLPRKTELLLWVAAGGRCEFDGCNTYLISHHVTKATGKYGEVAHVIAFSIRGPRGSVDVKNIHSIDNLMLLCHACHVLVDRERPGDYSVETLMRHKQEHELRIRRQTDARPDRQTTVVQLRSRIGGQVVQIPPADIWDAVAPRYPADSAGIVINLTSLDDSNVHFVQSAVDVIDRAVARLYDTDMNGQSVSHLSVFALAPMPLLVHLGSRLSNKVPLDLYQRHRDSQQWTWKTEGAVATYETRRYRTGNAGVALVLSLSGQIDLSKLPLSLHDYSIYEMSLADTLPNPTFLHRKESLDRFRMAYHQALATILAENGQLSELTLFPAVPAPIAVACGYELLPKVHPQLNVYDNDKRVGGWQYSLSVSANNRH